MVSRDRVATAVALPQHQQEEKEGGGGSGGNGGAIAAKGGAAGSLAESSYSIMNNTFRVDSRYSGLKAIGKGSFGFVCSALDEKQVPHSSCVKAFCTAPWCYSACCTCVLLLLRHHKKK